MCVNVVVLVHHSLYLLFSDRTFRFREEITFCASEITKRNVKNIEMEEKKRNVIWRKNNMHKSGLCAFFFFFSTSSRPPKSTRKSTTTDHETRVMYSLSSVPIHSPAIHCTVQLYERNDLIIMKFIFANVGTFF